MEAYRLAPYLGVVIALTCYGLPLSPAVPFVVLGLLAITSLMMGRPVQRLASGLELKLLGLFALLTVLSVLLSADRLASVPAILPLISSGLLILVLAKDFQRIDLPWLQRAFLALSLAISVSVALAAATAPGLTPSQWIMRANLAYLVVPNDLLILALLAPHSLALMYGDDHLLIRIIAALVLAASLALTIIFRSRLTLATMALGIVVGLLVLRTRIRWLLAALTLMALAFVVVDGVTGFALTGKILHGTWDTRLPLWLAAWHMFLDAPLWGHGPYTFGILGPAYLHALTLPAWVVIDPRYIPWPHNLYLELLAERGAVSLMVLLALLVLILIRIVYGLRRSDAALRRHFAAVLGFFVCFLLAGIFELSFDRYWLVTVFFINVAYVQVLTEEEGVNQNER